MQMKEGQRVELVLCMNGGDGKGSYAKNSSFQRSVISSARLGLRYGAYALLAVSEIIDLVAKTCKTKRQPIPSFMAFLNDLPSNDFNSVFKSLPDFYDRQDKEDRKCFVAAVPGSFYGRLFPSRSLHLVHSSCTLHWLSQVPRGLISESGEALNKGNYCIAETSSLAVQEAYWSQFRGDFNEFLNSRSEELMLGGSMVLTLLGSGRSNAPFKVHEIIGLTLLQMANEGVIKDSKLDEFNMPVHAPSADQISEVIHNEGSFDIRRLESLQTSWDAGMDENEMINKSGRGEFVAKYMKAVAEPFLAPAFGEAVMDDLFQRVALKYSNVMDVEDCYYHSIVVWLTRKTR